MPDRPLAAAFGDGLFHFGQEAGLEPREPRAALADQVVVALKDQSLLSQLA